MTAATRLLVWTLGVFATTVVVALLVTFWHVTEVGLIRVIGNRDEAGAWYGFWSGLGGALPDVLILTAWIAWTRRVNCHVKGCPRPGHLMPKGHRLCHRHCQRPLGELHLTHTIHEDHR